MKIGMIFECGPHGADKKVCEHLAGRLDAQLQIKSVTLDNKPNLISQCGQAAAILLKEGYERIVIIWDLYPPWREEKPCRKEDREAIIKSVTDAQVPLKCVHLICIIEELEAWLLADERAIKTVLTALTHPHPIRRVRRVTVTELVSNPKKSLIKTFRAHSCPAYSDLIHAERLVKAMPDLKRIKGCDSFVRFAERVTGKNAKNIDWE